MILAIDPGNEYSAYVLLNDDMSLIEGAKVENKEMLNIFDDYTTDANLEKLTDGIEDMAEELHIAIEMIASYGMAVGKSVFDTCVFIGQLKQIAEQKGFKVTYIYRKDEKMTICNSMKAKDSNIRQALIDEYAKFDFKNGKGTKANPDTFYGFKADMWAAFAVGHTYKKMYLEKK